MNPRANSAFTWFELTVGAGVVVVLVALLLPALSCMPCSSSKVQTLINMKQLHLATQSLALDGETQTNALLGWPGDKEGTYVAWVRSVVPEYLSTNDFCKLSSAPGVNVPLGKLPKAMRDGAVLVYSVRKDSPGQTVFLSTANFTNTPSGGLPLAFRSKPYRKSGFAVFCREGSGSILTASQVGQTNLIGAFVPLLEE